MKEEDLESVTEAKGASMLKKTCVLEALAKYNLKKQQEREESAKSSPKTSPEPSPLKQKKEGDGTSEIAIQEVAVGITEYINKGRGFSAILKQRYSDFQVSEIDLDGNVVRLTNQAIISMPKEDESPPTEEELSVLTSEQWVAMEEMMKSEEKKVVQIDVTEKDKHQRLAIHHVLRKKLRDVASDSKPVDGKVIMQVFKHVATKGRDHRHSQDPAQPRGTKYLQFVLYKENLSTMEATNIISRRARLKPSLLSTAGTKDKRAITCQLMTLRFGNQKKLLDSLNYEKRLAVGNFSFTDKQLELGQLMGNRFSIALRNVIGDQNVITESLESLKKNGFINYYGSQRFGTRHVPTHRIGKQILMGNFEAAIDLILEPPPHGKCMYDYDLYLARVEWKASKDAKRAITKLTRSFDTIEGQLLSSLAHYGKDWVGALGTLSRNIRLTYIHAYQSLLWNTVTSRRLAEFGMKPVVGDLVYAPDSNQDDDLAPLDSEELEPEKDAENDRCGASKPRAQRNQRKVIAIDEHNIGNYTIEDVLLPLPGYDIIYPANEVAGWYAELMKSDGLDETSFKQRVKAYNLGGAYRLIISKPKDVQWRFVRYNDPSLSLIPSDRDKLKGVEMPVAEVEDGTYLGLLLEFSLPSSAYATMALREITKMDMSAEFQTSLNEAGGSVPKQAPAKKPSSEEAKEEQPDNKRMKLKEALREIAKTTESQTPKNETDGSVPREGPVTTPSLQGATEEQPDNKRTKLERLPIEEMTNGD